MNNKFKGTTINERLFISGNLKKFDNALKEKNIENIIKILNNVEITDDLEIEHILKSLGIKKDR